MSTAAAAGPVANSGAAAAAKVPGAAFAAADAARCDNCGAAVTGRYCAACGLSFFYLVSGSLMLGLVSVYSVFTL